MKGAVKKILQGGIAFAVTVAAGAQGAPGVISNSPLIVGSATDPNLMFLFDSSGSMNNIVPEFPYDAATNYVTCPAAQIIDESAGHVDVNVLSDGKVSFKQNGVSYDWGVADDPAIGHRGFSQKCFDSTASYNARLYGNGGAINSAKFPDGYLWAVYTGNYLNWYFANAGLAGGDDFGTDARLKFGTTPRLLIAQKAAADVIGSFDNVRLGLATYNGDEGADIKEGLDDIAVNSADIIRAINDVEATGSTPLAKSFEQIGRYFVEGYADKDISYTEHKDGSTVIEKASEVFSREPKYTDSSSHKPTTAKPAIKEFCQANFLMVLTDGRPQDDQDISEHLEDFDADCYGADPACVGDDKKDGRDYESEGSDHMDDVAQALYEIDLRPDLVDFDGNEVVNNVTTYMIGFADDQVINDPLIKETASQGGGLFLTAEDSDSLSDALETVTTEIFAQVGSAASVAFNSTSLGTDSAVFFARFNTNRWSGELFAFPLSGTGEVEPKAWEASEALDSIAPSSRAIFTHNGTDGVNFQWASLSAAQQADLKIDKTGAIDTDANGEERLNYLRGDRSNEGSGIELRIRNSRLGDIVDSTPVFVGSPGLGYSNESPFGTTTKTYDQFQTAQSSRAPMVYVGANDGMLHGFNGNISGAGGDEVFAYVPAEVFSSDLTNPNQGLHYLASTDYEHRFYVNASPTVSDVFIKRATTDTEADWRTILIGGTGAGGKGIFALDVTDPTEFSESDSTNAPNVVLWEFTGADDADLGATYSKPAIAMMNNGQWAVIFGNGYNNSGDGKAKVFILFIEEGVDGSWSVGDYLKLETEVGSTTDINGMSSLAVADVDGDLVLDRIYGGDLYGNIWVFDVSSPNSGSWKSAYKSGTTPKPLFTATDPDGGAIRQPITAGPALVRNTSGDDEGEDIMVLFGSGQYLVQADISNTAKQSFYGVWDHGDQELGRSNLVSRTLTENAGLRTIASTIAAEKAIDWSAKHGWYVDFDVNDTGHTGERVISNAQVRGAVMFINTIIPNALACVSGGSGFLMSLDPQTGLAPDFAVFDADNDGDIDSDDLIYVGEYIDGLPAQSGILGDRQYTPTSKGTLEDRKVETGGSDRLGRLAWEEMVQGL